LFKRPSAARDAAPEHIKGSSFALTRRYELGPFRLDAMAGVLSNGDVPTALGRRGVAVLTVLVAHAPEVVTKQALLHAAWPDLVVEDNNLATQIAAIRRALAHSAGGERWIETLARRGYRFVGPVTEAAGQASRPHPTGRPALGGAPEWARRHLAVLQVRLVASPAVDLARALIAVAETVRSFGGQVADSSPIGLVAVFGLTPADNAPSHAVLAAIEIHSAAARARASSLWQVDAVTAIDSDQLLVRPQGARFDIEPDGKLALWTRLERMAAVDSPGSIFVTAAVVPFLERRFAVEALPDTRPSMLRLVPQAPSSVPSTPFVGRSSERSTLFEASVLASQGQTQVAGVVGEAGVGKSRLVHEIARQLHGWRVLVAGCAPYAVNTSNFLLAQLLKRYCQVQDADPADAVRNKVAQTVPPEAGDPAWLLPALFEVLGVLPADDAYRAFDPALRRRRTQDALRQVFLAATAAGPLCLIVEDLQWIDGASREVLDGIVHGGVHARLLLLANYRPEHQHAWSHKSCFRQVRLDTLPAENTGKMLDALFGVDAGLAPLKQQLARHGNPFYLEETLRDLVETGTLAGSRGHYRLMRPIDTLAVPETVQAILAARVDRLAPDDRRLLQVAATIGKDVPLVLLLAVAGLSEEPLRRALEALEAAEFLHQTGLYPHLTYTFKHALTHEVTYGSVPPKRRSALHADIFEAIERAYPDRLTEQVEMLAHHALRGQKWQAAVHYLHQAGIKAMENSANGEAAEFFEQALAALNQCPPQRVTLERRVDLRFALKAALIPLGAFERILASLRDAEPEVVALGDARRLGQFHMHMCQMLNLTGHSAEAVARGEKALTVVEPLGDRSLQMTGSLFLGIAYFSMLDHRRSEPLFLQVLQGVGGDRQRFGLTGYPAVSARAYLTRIASDQGRFEDGIRLGQAGVDLADALNHPYSQCVVYWHLADLYISKGELERAVALIEHALVVARQWNQALYVAANSGLLGRALALLGRADEGLLLMEQAICSFEAMKHGFALSLLLVPLGETYLLAGRPQDALAIARRALLLALDSGQRGGAAGALRLLGDVAAQQGDAADAEQHYRSALAIATELEMRPLAAHCHIGLGRLHRSMGQQEYSAGHLATAISMYREMGMNHWLASVDTPDDHVS
jgi:DNA-binding winged helix-turn-helix (wHTH) protein/tetratricopeptide (TPR) repeat protein